jgi:glycosyltransferase involved in cell wall biosynthesis
MLNDASLLANSADSVNQLRPRTIYIACPWTAKGGGMFKVADYLIQEQGKQPLDAVVTAQLRALDTRGSGSAIQSLWVLAKALTRLVRGRLTRQLAGVHVNMAERLSLFRKSMVIIVSRGLGIPVVLHLHAAQLHHFYRALPPFLRLLTRWVFGLPSTVIVLGEMAREFVVKELQVPPDRVTVVINGVPAPKNTKTANQAKVSSEVRSILFVGNLSERKGVSDLLLACSYLQTTDVIVTFAGGGDVAAYEAKALALKVNNFVRFIGWTEQAQVAQLMETADVLVLPSYDEGLPLVILEAMANGVAVICTPVGEIPLALTHDVNACFVDPGNPAQLAQAMQRLLSNTGDREVLARNGYNLYQQKFSMPRFFESIAQIHQRDFGVCAASTVSAGATKQKPA